MVFFSFDQGQIVVSQQVWIYPACTLPLTFVVLGVSYAWIIRTWGKVEKPNNYSADRSLAQTADALRLGAGARKEGV